MAVSGSPDPIELKFNHEFLSKLLLDSYSSSMKLVDFDLSKRNLPGENFMSVIYQLKLNVNEKEKDKVLSLILKSLPVNPILLRSVRGMKAFEKEVVMFQRAFPNLLSVDKGYTSLPSYVSSSLDEQTGYILMEDLTATGYKMANRISGLDLEHAQMTISELAKFHALSFIKYHGNGKDILEKYPDLAEMFWVAPDVVPDGYRHFVNDTAAKIIQVLKDENKDVVIPRVERHFGNVFERSYKQTAIPEKFPAVINFGDCWTNNCMFQYDDQGKPTSIKFLDFQLARVTSRCSDLSYLLFTSVNMAVLNENFDKLLRTYHETFNSFVSSHDNGKGASLLQFNGDELSWEYFNMEFEQYRSFGTTSALIYTPLMLASSDAVPDFDGLKKNMSKDRKNDASDIWKCKAVREKLIALASGHLPICFKPAQAP